MSKNVQQGRRNLSKAGQASSYVGRHNFSPLVDIGVTDLPKPRWAIAPSSYPRTIHVQSVKQCLKGSKKTNKCLKYLK